MILTKEVIVKWNGSNRKHYENLGYIFSKQNDEFIVPIEHLPEKSNVIIEVQCDYCNKKVKRSFSDHKRRKSPLLDLDSCKKCSVKKRKEERLIMQREGLLDRSDNSYWTFKDNRVEEIKKFIKNNNGSIDDLAIKDRPLYDAIWKYETSLESFLNELGIEWDNVCSVSANNKYKDFKIMSEKINEFIESNNRFPTKQEIIKTYGIQQRDIDFHGGIYEIKRKIGHQDKDDLVDFNGFINRSILEWTVAQFLIKNKITYKREQRPFLVEEGYFRSDFKIESLNGKVFFAEVWGYNKNESKGFSKNYNTKRKIKEKLYSKYNLNLISVEYEDMTNKSLDQIQDYLIHCFSVIKPNELKTIGNEFLISPTKLSDNEILSIVMKFSNDNNVLPKQEILSNEGLSGILREIRKRHKTYLSFGKKFGKVATNRKFEWNDEEVYNAMKDINEQGLPVNRKNIEVLSYGGLFCYISKYKKSNLLTFKLNFFEQFTDSISIPSEDEKFLLDCSINKGINIMNIVTPEQQEQAKRILEKYYSRHLTPTN